MSRLTVKLYDSPADVNPFRTIHEDVDGHFVNLNDTNDADKASRIVIEPGADYHPGDHVRLLNVVKLDYTDMVTADPLVSTDVDLNKVNFADTAAALHFQLNPSCEFHVRVDLYDQTDQPYPNLSLYDWQVAPGKTIDLNPLHFADKAARVRLATGGVIHPDDLVQLLDEVGSASTATLPLKPFTDPDVYLGGLGWADRAAGLVFALNAYGLEEAKIIYLTNENHKSVGGCAGGCASLKADPRLMAVARAHSQDLASHPNLYNTPPPGLPANPGHYGSDGSTFDKRIETAINSPGAIAENVCCPYPSFPTAQEAFDAWWKSEPHRRNMLDCNYKFIGVGIAQAPDGTRYYTQDFTEKA